MKYYDLILSIIGWILGIIWVVYIIDYNKSIKEFDELFNTDKPTNNSYGLSCLHNKERR